MDTQPETKDFNIIMAVIKVGLIGVSVFAILFTVKAAFTDTVLENLEKNYSQAINLHASALDSAKRADAVERGSADNACNSFKALKSYKESRQLTLKNDDNPCITLRAPQEGF